MTGKNFSYEHFIQKYPEIDLIITILSFEYYATNTVISDYSKGESFIPSGEPEVRRVFTEFNDEITLIANIYPNNQLGTQLNRVTATFIDNELSDSILLNTLIGHKDDSDSVLLGGTSLKYIDKPYRLMLSPEKDIFSGCAAGKILSRNQLSAQERKDFINYTIESQIRLCIAIKEHNKLCNSLKSELLSKCKLFNNAIKKASHKIFTKHKITNDGKSVILTAPELWFVSDTTFHSFDIHIMLAKFLNLKDGWFCCREIYSSKKSKPSYKQLNEERVYDSNGIEIINIKNIHIEDLIKYHIWLMFDDLFDVDLLYGSLAPYLHEDLPDIMISRGCVPDQLDNWNGIKQKLEFNGYICEPIKIAHKSEAEFQKYFSSNNNLIESVYQLIISEI